MNIEIYHNFLKLLQARNLLHNSEGVKKEAEVQKQAGFLNNEEYDYIISQIGKPLSKEAQQCLGLSPMHLGPMSGRGLNFGPGRGLGLGQGLQDETDLEVIKFPREIKDILDKETKEVLEGRLDPEHEVKEIMIAVNGDKEEVKEFIKEMEEFLEKYDLEEDDNEEKEDEDEEEKEDEDEEEKDEEGIEKRSEEEEIEKEAQQCLGLPPIHLGPGGKKPRPDLGRGLRYLDISKKRKKKTKKKSSLDNLFLEKTAARFKVKMPNGEYFYTNKEEEAKSVSTQYNSEIEHGMEAMEPKVEEKDELQKAVDEALQIIERKKTLAFNNVNLINFASLREQVKVELQQEGLTNQRVEDLLFLKERQLRRRAQFEN